APDFVPAAALAAALHTEAGEPRKSAKLLKKAWATAPHPDLAAAFAAIEPNETADARQTRFQTLTAANPEHPESKMVSAELALAAEDFPGARRALGGLAEDDPTTRSLAIMAAIEKGEGASDTVVRGWLAKALTVPRSETWICSNCNAVYGAWRPVCDACEAFDTLTWTRPTETGQTDSAATAMLPLIIGALEDKSGTPSADEEPGMEDTPGFSEPQTTDVPPEAEPQATDAETVDVEATPEEPKQAAAS
ncbi:MAG: heme biosynthesis protein HemY, partial [Pseudomonadota bacterium]